MKPYFKSPFILLILAVTTTQCQKDKNQTYINITDEGFLQDLIYWGVDRDHDGKISVEEAENCTQLILGGEISYEGYVWNCTSRKGIYSLQGIESFSNLERLTIWCTHLQSIDLGKNTKLKYLSCFENFLQHIDISGCYELEEISCSGNQLTHLDLSNNLNLIYLDCSDNPISNLDISINTMLEYIFLKDMSYLEAVCTWEIPFPPPGIEVDISNSPNVYFTTDCSK